MDVGLNPISDDEKGLLGKSVVWKLKERQAGKQGKKLEYAFTSLCEEALARGDEILILVDRDDRKRNS